MRLRQLQLLMMIVTAMVTIDALWNPVVLLMAKLVPAFFAANITPIADIVDTGALILKLLTMIVFGRWIYVAGRNLVEAGFEDLEFTPAARIWWYAVPFANLVKPFQGMRELWNASRGTTPYDLNDGLIGTWWALWLINSLTGNLAARLGGPGDGGTMVTIDAIAGILLAPVAILLVRRITAAQQRLTGAALAEIFA